MKEINPMTDTTIKIWRSEEGKKPKLMLVPVPPSTESLSRPYRRYINRQLAKGTLYTNANGSRVRAGDIPQK